MAKSDQSLPARGPQAHDDYLPERPPLDHSSLVRMAVEEIRLLILSGRVQPGERLKEEQLTVQLGVSRSPLREALRQVAHEGLVTIQPRRGATVTQLSDHDVYEILTLRSALEELAVELGVPCLVAERMRACGHWVMEMQECARRKDRARMVEAGYQFHRAIVRLAGHERVNQIWDSLHRQLLMCMAMNLYAREHHYEDLTEHARRHLVLYELIQAGDPQAVLAELAVHGERSFIAKRRTEYG